MESGTPFWEGDAAGAFGPLQNPPSSPDRLEHSGPYFLGTPSCHGRTRSLGPRVFSSSSLPVVVSALQVSSAFPFRLSLYVQQMDHTMNHSPNLGSIRQDQGLIQSLKSKALDRLSLVFGSPDAAPFPAHRNRLPQINPFSFLWFFHIFYPRSPRAPSVGRCPGGWL
jgi:hypothetical protein